MRPINAVPRETRVIAASPRTRLARLPEAERQLLLLLISLGPTEARERLDALSAERREELAPLVAEVSILPAEERHALFSVGAKRNPSTSKLNSRLQRERPQLAALLLRELAPRRASASVLPARAADPAFGRTLAAIARRWLTDARN